MIRIEGTTPISGANAPAIEISKPTTAADMASGMGFEGVLSQAVHQASALERAASDQSARLAAGLSDDLHGTMIASKEAEISLKLVGSIRNKLLDAFHEIWRTNV